MRRLSGLLPSDTYTYRGDPWVTRFYLFLTLVITFRSLVHVFPEAQSLASTSRKSSKPTPQRLPH